MNKEAFQVFWTQTAQQDLKKIFAYISADSETNAKRFYLAIKQKAENLRQMPFQGRVVPELEYYSILTYRELITPPWRIVYKVEGDNVWLLAVFDGRRNLEDILLDRFF